MSADEHLRDDDWYLCQEFGTNDEPSQSAVPHEGPSTTPDDTQMVADAYENDDFWLPPPTTIGQPTARASGTPEAPSLSGGDHNGTCGSDVSNLREALAPLTPRLKCAAQRAGLTRDSWGEAASTIARPASSFSLNYRHGGDTDMTYHTNGLLESLRHNTSSHPPIRTSGNSWRPSHQNQLQGSHGLNATAQYAPQHNVPPAAARVESSASEWQLQQLGGSTPIGSLFQSPTMAVSTPPSPAATRENARSEKARKDPKVSILRPLTPYNFFYRFERDQLLKCDTHDPLSVKYRQDDPYQSIMENIVDFQTKMLHDHWFQDRSVKRKHCKSHGRISFQALTKHVAQSWRAMPEPVKQVFKAISARDQYRYTLEKEALDVSHSKREE